MEECGRTEFSNLVRSRRQEGRERSRRAHLVRRVKREVTREILFCPFRVLRVARRYSYDERSRSSGIPVTFRLTGDARCS